MRLRDGAAAYERARARPNAKRTRWVLLRVRARERARAAADAIANDEARADGRTDGVY